MIGEGTTATAPAGEKIAEITERIAEIDLKTAAITALTTIGPVETVTIATADNCAINEM